MNDCRAAPPRNTPNIPLKEVMAVCETSRDWPEAALKFAQGAGESLNFLEELARDRVLKKKSVESSRSTGP